MVIILLLIVLYFYITPNKTYAYMDIHGNFVQVLGRDGNVLTIQSLTEELTVIGNPIHINLFVFKLKYVIYKKLW